MKECFWGIVFFIFLPSCYISGGTHGSIQGYHYSVSKCVLEKAIWKTLKTNGNIFRDTVNKGFYNDSITYITFKIKKGDLLGEYTIRYMGDDGDWKKSPNGCEIFICYVYDKNGVGGSEGDGGVKKLGDSLRDVLKLIESELIDKVDVELGLKHVCVK